MALKLLRGLLWATAVLGAVGIALLAVLWLQGSAEAFPTDEQNEKVRITFGVMLAFLVAVEVAVVLALKRLAEWGQRS